MHFLKLIKLELDRGISDIKEAPYMCTWVVLITTIFSITGVYLSGFSNALTAPQTIKIAVCLPASNTAILTILGGMLVGAMSFTFAAGELIHIRTTRIRYGKREPKTHFYLYAAIAVTSFSAMFITLNYYCKV